MGCQQLITIFFTIAMEPFRFSDIYAESQTDGDSLELYRKARFNILNGIVGSAA